MILKKETPHLLGNSLLKVSYVFLILMLFSCHKKEDIKQNQFEFLLSAIDIDYHYIEYITLRESVELYVPENIVLRFAVTNNSKTLLNVPLYSKSNQLDTLSLFYIIYKQDTILLESVSDRLVVSPNKIDYVTTELPFSSYNIFRELIKGATVRKDSFDTTFKVGFKRQGLDYGYQTIDQTGAEVILLCADSTKTIMKF